MAMSFDIILKRTPWILEINTFNPITQFTHSLLYPIYSCDVCSLLLRFPNLRQFATATNKMEAKLVNGEKRISLSENSFLSFHLFLWPFFSLLLHENRFLHDTFFLSLLFFTSTLIEIYLALDSIQLPLKLKIL